MSDDSDRRLGFHAGELAVQAVAGVRAEAARLEGMLQRGRLSDGVARFLGGRTFAAVSARDVQGRLWTSPLVGDPGFLQVVDPVTLRLRTTPGGGDPLGGLPVPQPVGLVAIDYERRRRYRLNGTLLANHDGLTIEVVEAFGNCPQFLPQRTIDTGTWGAPEHSGVKTEATTMMGDADRAVIGRADTFILGTTHPSRGNDASHRGGPPGFVRSDGDILWWPDYAGNNMFTSLGNLAVDDEASLLFLDFSGHTSLHLHGTAKLASVPVGSPGDDGHTGRRVVFTVRDVRRSTLAAHSALLSGYPHHPPLTD